MTPILEALDIDANNPEVIAEQQDFTAYADLIAQLVARRKELGLSQTAVAAAMGTRQSAVSEIESSSANPTIQRLQRYARAVGARLELHSVDVNTTP